MRDSDQWDLLQRAWREGGRATDGGPSSIDVRRHEGRRVRRARALFLLRIALSVAIPVVVFDGLRHHPDGVSFSVAAFVALHVVAVWGHGYWIRRGADAPLGDTAAGYLRALAEQCRRERRSVQFLALLLVLDLAALLAIGLRVLPLAALGAHLSSALSAGEVVAAIGGVAGFGTWLALAWRSATRQLQQLGAEVRSLGDT